jgi:uncharacterized BrkB/YihY/UPF0761 family membrane protein
MDYSVLAYIIYLTISVVLTIWVARTLFNNGKVFLNDIFHGNKPLAESMNKLLLVGFYLINLGYVVLMLKIWEDIPNYRVLIETLAVKVGTIIIILGLMHFLNLFTFFSLRKKAKTPPKLEVTPENKV